MNVTVFGATGGIGRAIVHELAARGHRVTAASRTVTPADVPEGAVALPTDLRDPVVARAAVEAADVVVMAAQIPYSGWATELFPLVDAALDATATVGARFVMVDNLYAYGSPGTPLTESTPESATTRKGQLRRDLGRHLLAAHAAGRVRVTIGRFSDYYGPDGTNSVLYQLGVKRVVAGKAPRAYIAADQPHIFHYLPDAARGFATLVERPDADGRVWILPAAPPITQHDLLSLLADAAGLTRKVGRVTPAMLWLVGLINRDLREAREVVDQFDRPYTVDASAFEQAFGPIELTDHDDAVAQTLASYRIPTTEVLA
jgi:nucleoside-diphosphate-sugar epimerase